MPVSMPMIALTAVFWASVFAAVILLVYQL
jgi:hypothetical protein